MKIAIAREVLIAGFDRILKVVPTSKTVPILNYAKLDAVGESLLISATDRITSVRVHVDKALKVAEEGSVLVPVHDLVSGLRSSTASLVAITGESGHVTALAKGQAKWAWQTPMLDQYPSLYDPDGTTTYLLDRTSLLASLRAVKSAASRGTFNPRLEQIGIRKGKVQAADGIRYHEVDLPNTDMIDLALPVRFVDEILPMLSADTQTTVELGSPDGGSTISIRSGNVLMSTRRSQEDFPDVSHSFLIPAMSNNIELKVTRTDLLGAVRRVRVSADQTTKAVRMTLQGFDSLDVSTKQKSGSWAQETIPAKWSGGGRDLVFNHEHLTSLLSLFEDESLILKLGPDAKFKPSALLVQAEDKSRSGVLQQFRVDWRQ